MYNRQSYSFNKTLEQERLYHLQKMRIDQIKLYRDDIRDLFGLVVGKMNNYYLINTLMLGVCLGFYYDGKIPVSVPSWLYWLWAMSLGSAIVFLFLSVWFAVHASVVAQMFSTRLLTQWLRLPVPGPAQIDAGAPKLEEFEKVPAGQQFRLPVVSAGKTVVGASNGGVADPATTHDALIQEGYSFYMGHFYMFARLQKHWMGLDAYCRVCMVLGCNQILNVVIYTGLAWFMLFDYQWGTIAFFLIPLVFSVIHAQINFLLSQKEAVLFLSVHCLGPLLASAAAAVQMVETNEDMSTEGADIAQIISLVSYFFHFLSAAFLLYFGLDLHNGLPSRFTTVNYIDVLGMKHAESPHVSSGKLSGILSSSVSSAPDKKQPPMRQVVPAASTLLKADSMYLSLVERKRLEETDPSLVRAVSDKRDSGDQHLVGSFATRHVDSRKSFRWTNSFLRASTAPLAGMDDDLPKDYAPTTAQLHSPDLLGRTPYLAFKLVGIAILLLWLAGIVFASLSVSQSVDFGWINIISPNSSSHRRLLDNQYVYIPPPGKFFSTKSVHCINSHDGGFVVSDSQSDRKYAQTLRGDTFNCNEESPHPACTAGGLSHPIPVKQTSNRVFSLGNTTITVPLDFSNNFIDPSFLRVTHQHTLIGVSKSSADLLLWKADTGDFIRALHSPCSDIAQTELKRVFAVCGVGDITLSLIFEAGDSCSLQLI